MNSEPVKTITETEGAIRLEQCMLQAELFRMASEKGCDSRAFIEGFMKPETARSLDTEYGRMQAEVPAYIMAALEDEDREYIRPGTCRSAEEMEWTGYLYRLWHYETGESSRDIYRQADVDAVHRAYNEKHDPDGKAVIRGLKEAYTMTQEGPVAPKEG